MIRSLRSFEDGRALGPKCRHLPQPANDSVPVTAMGVNTLWCRAADSRHRFPGRVPDPDQAVLRGIKPDFRVIYAHSCPARCLAARRQLVSSCEPAAWSPDRAGILSPPRYHPDLVFSAAIPDDLRPVFGALEGSHFHRFGGSQSGQYEALIDTGSRVSLGGSGLPASVAGPDACD